MSKLAAFFLGCMASAHMVNAAVAFAVGMPRVGIGCVVGALVWTAVLLFHCAQP